MTRGRGEAQFWAQSKARRSSRGWSPRVVTEGGHRGWSPPNPKAFHRIHRHPARAATFRCGLCDLVTVCCGRTVTNSSQYAVTVRAHTPSLAGFCFQILHPPLKRRLIRVVVLPVTEVGDKVLAYLAG